MGKKLAKPYYLIVGLGATGISIARHLEAADKSFCVFDTRTSSSASEFFAVEFPSAEIFMGDIDETVLLEAEEIYLSPGVPREETRIAEAISAGKSVVGDIELFLREAKAPIVAITGSNGKSTVTSLVGLAAEEDDIRVSVGGNIGTPALDLLLENPDLYILELSSFQLESTYSTNFLAACILNVSPDHMDRYDTFAQYVMAKHRIYKDASKIVYNLDDPHTRPPVIENVERLAFGLHDVVNADEEQYCFYPETGELKSGQNLLINKNDIKIKGIHNVHNALALFAIADASGISRDACIKTLETFSGLPHRCEIIAEQNGITFINDSKGTNVGATVAAINGLAPEFDRIVLIAGGEGKGADFTDLAKAFEQNIDALVLIGKDAKSIAEVAPKECDVTFASNMAEAVSVASSKAGVGDLVLLSPACASFDMFNSFEERGLVFEQCVKTGGSNAGT